MLLEVIIMDTDNDKIALICIIETQILVQFAIQFIVQIVI